MGDLRAFPTILTTSDSVTLFWEKHMEASPSWSYRLLADGMVELSGTKTHFTLHNLHPGKQVDLTLQVFIGDSIWHTMWQGVCQTRPVRRKIDISRPPYSAVGDGKTLNTTALQKALDACGQDDMVYFPAGVYLTGALTIHSNTEIYLEKNAILQGTSEAGDYLPKIPSRFEGIESMCYSSLLNLGTLNHQSGPNCENVLIHGKGTIASGGQILARHIIEDERRVLAEYLHENQSLVATCENNDTIPGRVRPRLVNMSNCKNLRISGLTLKNGASWNVHMIYSSHITTDHCTFVSEGVWNGDGWDPDSSENCAIFACRFFTGDDAVAVKSGKNPEGNLIARPSRHILIFDCNSAFGHGICIGSEMSGGIEKVHIWDCNLANSYSGIEIKGTQKRGGYVRDIFVQDCITPRVMIHSVPYNDDGIPAPAIPVFTQFRFDRITLTGLLLDHDYRYNECTAIEICGFDPPGHEVRDVRFIDCLSQENTSIRIQKCQEISIDLKQI